MLKQKESGFLQKKRLFPLDVFQKEVIKADRNFYQVLEADRAVFNRAVFILECKKGSPSKGVIRKKFDLNEIAAVYKNYANVISVITDEEVFYR